MTNSPSPATPAPSATEESHGPSPENILKLGTAFWASKALLSAVELEIFTQLSTQKGTVEDLQKRLALHPRSVVGLEMTYEAPVLRHFTAKFQPIGTNAPSRMEPFAGFLNNAPGDEPAPAESTNGVGNLPEPPSLG